MVKYNVGQINVRYIEHDDVVVMRGLEFPNVIVQAETLKKAKAEFVKALNYSFKIRAKMDKENYPLKPTEKIKELNMEMIYNE